MDLDIVGARTPIRHEWLWTYSRILRTPPVIGLESGLIHLPYGDLGQFHIYPITITTTITGNTTTTAATIITVDSTVSAHFFVCKIQVVYF